jgi:hypothetical protein
MALLVRVSSLRQSAHPMRHVSNLGKAPVAGKVEGVTVDYYWHPCQKFRLHNGALKPSGAFSAPALAKANLSSGYAETKILGSRPDGSHWPVELHCHQREAFPGLRHRPQKVVVFFRPALVVI